MAVDIFLGLDLGQVGDSTALAAVDLVQPPAPPWTRPDQWWGRRRPKPPPPPAAIARLRFLERLPLKTSYPDIVRHVVSRMESVELHGRADLIVDATGVGRPVVDLFREAGLRPVAVTITASTKISIVDGEMRVPKRDLVQALQVLLAQGRFRYLKTLPLAPQFLKEAESFRMKIDKLTAHDSYAARDGEHDDIVLAVALATWWAQRRIAVAFGERAPIPGHGRRFAVGQLRTGDTRERYESGDEQRSKNDSTIGIS
ncbi:MAG: hypothetical protein ACYDCP_07075 [Thermoplasmataceae archaeon]